MTAVEWHVVQLERPALRRELPRLFRKCRKFRDDRAADGFPGLSLSRKSVAKGGRFDAHS